MEMENKAMKKGPLVIKEKPIKTRVSSEIAKEI